MNACKLTWAKMVSRMRLAQKPDNQALSLTRSHGEGVSTCEDTLSPFLCVLHEPQEARASARDTPIRNNKSATVFRTLHTRLALCEVTVVLSRVAVDNRKEIKPIAHHRLSRIPMWKNPPGAPCESE